MDPGYQTICDSETEEESNELMNGDMSDMSETNNGNEEVEVEINVTTSGVFVLFGLIGLCLSMGACARYFN